MIAAITRFFFGTFRRQLISGMIIFCIMVIGSLMTDLTLRQQGFLVEQKVKQAESLSTSVAVSVGSELMSGDFVGLQEIVDAQKYYPELEFAMIADKKGMVVAHTDMNRLVQYVTDMPAKAETTVINNTPDLIDVASPIFMNGRHIGWVRVGLNSHIITARLAVITLSSIIYGLVALFIAAILAYFMGNYLTRRIHTIQSVADAVQTVTMGQRADITGDDEVSLLARQFNSMLDRIDADEKQLKESESRYRTIFDDSPIAILEGDLSIFKVRLEELHQSGITDMEAYLNANPDEIINLAGLGRFNDVNQAAIRLMGAANKDNIAMSLYSYFTEGSVDVFRRQIIALDAGAMRFESEVPVQSITGEKRFITMSLVILPEYAATWSKILVSFVDITERKRAEEQIKRFNNDLEEKVRQRTAQLEAANKEMESFTYLVSHDLRAPLRAIDGFSAVVMEDYGDKVGAEGRGYLQRVRNASQKMSDLIDNLLSLPRLTMGELHKTSVNISDIAYHVIKNLRESDPDRDMEVSIAENMIVEADSDLIEMAVTHLLNNAWKFTSRKDKGKIEFNCIEKDGNKVYYIKDNGIGFDMNYVNKLFLPFQRLHTTENFPGSGIGLATVYRVIKKHNGRVWAEGEVNGGATFYFTLKGG
jgi:PAS domain S-box-containing protein